MIRLVVTDLDGTFWDRDMVVPAAHLAAVKALADRGVEVMVATSRRRRVAGERLARVGMVVPAVVLDGVMGIDLRDGRRFHDAPFTMTAAVDVLAVFRAHALEPCVYVDEDDVDVVLPSSPSTSRAHAEYLAPVARTGDLDAAVGAPGVYGFSVTGQSRSDMETLAVALVRYGAELMVFEEEKYGGWSIVVAPPEVTKWSGVLAWCALNGVGADEVLAVGDGDNDVDMLTRAGFGVAVHGGSIAALSVADHVVDGPEQGGWSEIVDIVDRFPSSGPKCWATDAKMD